ncbi:MDR family MFS transporter [Frateuria aurantia]
MPQTAPVSSPSESSLHQRPHYRVIALIVACAIFMEQLDATVLATALPLMAHDFHVAAPAMSVALTSYLLALAVLIPTSGVIADRFGSRKVMCGSILVFMLGSVACSVTHSMAGIIAARLLQGIGGAMMTPVGRLIILSTVERKDLVSAMSWALVPAFLGPILGPPLGGLIVTHLDWRWIFYINLPIGLLGLYLVWNFIPDVCRPRSQHAFDLLGFVLCGISSSSLLFGLEWFGPAHPDRLSIGLLAGGVLTAALYVRHARRHPHPLLDLGLLKIDSFRLSVISGSLMRITQGAQPFLLPLLFQVGFGYSPVRSGELVLATAFGAVVVRTVTPPLLRLTGFRRGLIGNGVLASLGYAVCAVFQPDWPMWLIFSCLFCCGAFMSFQFGAYNTIAYEAVPAEQMSSANSFYTMLQQLMLSVGVCVGALLLRLTMTARGHLQPESSDFSIAFIAITLISLSSTFWHRGFAVDAGAELSGHRPAR